MSLSLDLPAHSVTLHRTQDPTIKWSLTPCNGLVEGAIASFDGLGLRLIRTCGQMNALLTAEEMTVLMALTMGIAQ
jgi:hypothetical protein